MATRTRYRRTRTGMAFGGAFWRFDPASQTPGGGGAIAAAERGFEAPLPRAAAAASTATTPLQGLIGMGGQVTGRSADGSVIAVSSGGRTYYFDARTGQARNDLNSAQAAGGDTAAAPANTTTATGTRAVGSQITGRTAAGQQITGTVTGTDANGNTIIRWEDGAVSTYNAQGQLVSNTPAPGGAAAGGADTGAGGGAGGRQVGQPITSTTASGQQLTGTISDVRADGTFVVTWNDGATSYYSAGGQHITTLPANTGPSPEPRDVAPTDLSQQQGAPQTINTTPTGETPPTDVGTYAPAPAPDIGPVAAANPAGAPDYIADQGVSGGLGGVAANEPGITIGDALATTTAPTSPYAPPPIPIRDFDNPYYTGAQAAPEPAPSAPSAPQMYGDANGNLVTLEQLLAGTDARNTLSTASTLAAPDYSAPTPADLYTSSGTGQAGFDPGFVEPGVTSYVPPQDYGPPSDVYLTEY